ncbi:MAG: T9SS type A sorting domain-containing protein, partial [Bacteroidota bacterium]|nr:T9SS type A sorting domain-containing protein [Bacteroidota bacterium]
YVENLQSVSGCDSTVTTFLTVNPAYRRTENKNICEGQSYKGHTLSGMYTENLKAVSGCDSTITTNLIVNKIPAVPVITLNDSILKSNSILGNQWYFYDNKLPEATNCTYIPHQKGDYYVIVTIDNCSSKSSNVITFIPTGIKKNPDGNIIRIFPNPTSAMVRITLNNNLDSDYTVEICDNLGKVLQKIKKKKSEQNFDMDFGKYIPGVYLMHIYSLNRHFLMKVIKK